MSFHERIWSVWYPLPTSAPVAIFPCIFGVFAWHSGCSMEGIGSTTTRRAAPAFRWGNHLAQLPTTRLQGASPDPPCLVMYAREHSECKARPERHRANFGHQRRRMASALLHIAATFRSGVPPEQPTRLIGLPYGAGRVIPPPCPAMYGWTSTGHMMLTGEASARTGGLALRKAHDTCLAALHSGSIRRIQISSAR